MYDVRTPGTATVTRAAGPPRLRQRRREHRRKSKVRPVDLSPPGHHPPANCSVAAPPTTRFANRFATGGSNAPVTDQSPADPLLGLDRVPGQASSREAHSPPTDRGPISTASNSHANNNLYIADRPQQRLPQDHRRRPRSIDATDTDLEGRGHSAAAEQCDRPGGAGTAYTWPQSRAPLSPGRPSRQPESHSDALTCKTLAASICRIDFGRAPESHTSRHWRPGTTRDFHG